MEVSCRSVFDWFLFHQNLFTEKLYGTTLSLRQLPGKSKMAIKMADGTLNYSTLKANDIADVLRGWLYFTWR